MKLLIGIAMLCGSLASVSALACTRDAAYCDQTYTTICPRNEETCEWRCDLCPGRNSPSQRNELSSQVIDLGAGPVIEKLACTTKSLF